MGNTTGISIGGASNATLSSSLTGIVISVPITTANTGQTSTISFSRTTADTGSLTLNGAIGGNGNVTFSTPNVSSNGQIQTINLGAAGTWAGNTTMTTGNMNNATLIRNTSGAANVLPVTTVLTMSGGVGAGSGRNVTFDLNGQDQELAGLQNTTAADRNQRVTSPTAATLTINNTSDYTFGLATGGADPGNGQIAGAIALTKDGTGTFTLASGQAYTGQTTINGGGLRMEHANSLGSTAAGTVVNGSITASSGNARLELAGGISTNVGESITINGAGNFSGALTSASGNNNWQGDVTIGSAGTRIGAIANATLEVSGVIDSGVVNTGLNIRTANTTNSTVILSGANTYLGDTTIVIGKLQIAGGDDRLPVGTTLRLTGTTLANSTEFDLNGSNQEVAGISLGGGNAAFNSVNNSSATLSTFTVNTAAASTFDGILKGNLALTKDGANTLTLGGDNTYTGTTTVSAGSLIINGAVASTSVVVNGSLGGSGVLANATLSGSGSINPGNSPGIMTAAATNPTGGLDYNFEFTAANASPVWDAPLDSDNDVLRLTGATPFTADLAVTNIINIYFNLASLQVGDVLTGGFYTDNNADFLSMIDNAEFQFFIAALGGSESYGGNTYNPYTGIISTATVSQTANFGAGDVNGFTTQFTVIPEPSAAMLGGLGLMLLFRRRRA